MDEERNSEILRFKGMADARKRKSRKTVITSAYLNFNDGVGGYSFYYADDVDDHGHADAISYAEVFRLAEDCGLKRISLVGNWSSLNRKGWGEKVTIAVAKKLVKLKHQKRL